MPHAFNDLGTLCDEKSVDTQYLREGVNGAGEAGWCMPYSTRTFVAYSAALLVRSIAST